MNKLLIVGMPFGSAASEVLKLPAFYEKKNDSTKNRNRSAVRFPAGILYL